MEGATLNSVLHVPEASTEPTQSVEAQPAGQADEAVDGKTQAKPRLEPGVA